MIADTRVEKFRDEMDFALRKKFMKLARNLNGDGRPTTDQLKACVIESAGEIQARSPFYLEDTQFEEILAPFKQNPWYGESVRPLYDSVCNGDSDEKIKRNGESDV